MLTVILSAIITIHLYRSEFKPEDERQTVILKTNKNFKERVSGTLG